MLADPLGGRRAQVELTDRRPQVEARAADDDGAVSGLEQPVDLRMGELGVLPDAEGCVDGQERDQAVLEGGPLAGIGGPGQHLDRRVDLKRIRRHRDRPLAALPEQPGQGDRDLRLADSGRTEQCDHIGWWHRAEYRGAMARPADSAAPWSTDGGPAVRPRG